MKLILTTYSEKDSDILMALEAVMERIKEGDTEGYDELGEDRYEWKLTTEDR